MRVAIISIVLILKHTLSLTQTTGYQVFSTLLNEQSAKSIGSGYAILSDDSGDLSFNLENPALLNKKQAHQILCSQSFNSFFFNRGILAIGFKTKKINFMPYLSYSNYGDFESRNESGIFQGNFSALDYNVGTLISKNLSPQIRYGIDIGFLGSHIENYNAYGIKFGSGIVYKHPNELFSSSISFTNLGYQLKLYSSDTYKSLPMNLKLGTSYKLKHAPFKFSMILNEINNWKNYYSNNSIEPSIDILTGDTIPIEKTNFLEQIGHHLILQTELFLSKNVTFRFGFNYHKRKETMVDLRPGMSGFSTGLSIVKNNFELNYGYSMYSKAAQIHGLSISFRIKQDTDKFLK